MIGVRVVGALQLGHGPIGLTARHDDVLNIIEEDELPVAAHAHDFLRKKQGSRLRRKRVTEPLEASVGFFNRDLARRGVLCHHRALAAAVRDIFRRRQVARCEELLRAGVSQESFPALGVMLLELVQVLQDRPETDAVTRRETEPLSASALPTRSAASRIRFECLLSSFLVTPEWRGEGTLAAAACCQ